MTLPWGSFTRDPTSDGEPLRLDWALDEAFDVSSVFHRDADENRFLEMCAFLDPCGENVSEKLVHSSIITSHPDAAIDTVPPFVRSWTDVLLLTFPATGSNRL